MRRIAFGLVAALVFAAPGLADDCRDRIAAMFDGGALDAYQRPPHRHEKQVMSADGTVQTTFTSVVQTPLRTISGVKGGDMTLAVDDRTWTGPGPDGPWSESPSNFPPDRETWHKAMQAQQAANLTDVSCPGIVDVNGTVLENFRFSTRTDPNPDQNGAYFGSSDSVYVSPETGQVMRWDQSGLYSSWLPTPGNDLYVTRFDYDPAIRVDPPQ